MKEKDIEKAIVAHLRTLGAVAETQNGGSVMIKKGSYNHRMTLQTKGCPDIICFYKENFIGIEVKKDLKQVEKWLRLKERYLQGETLPKSYKRELEQIKYRGKILINGGVFIITHDINEIKEYFSNL